MNLTLAISIFNKKHESDLKAIQGGNSYTFIVDEEEIGSLNMTANISNCGILDLHYLEAKSKDNRALILSFAKTFAASNSRNILTYNTAAYQVEVIKSLKEAKFHAFHKTFKNKNSRADIQFHVVMI